MSLSLSDPRSKQNILRIPLRRYYGASGAKGYLKGHYYLACLYLEGPGQHQQDDTQTQNNTQQIADGAQLVPRDTGPPKDVRKALEILNIAAAKGYPDASYSIGKPPFLFSFCLFLFLFFYHLKGGCICMGKGTSKRTSPRHCNIS